MAAIFRTECDVCGGWFGSPTEKKVINHKRLQDGNREPCPGSGKKPSDWLPPMD